MAQTNFQAHTIAQSSNFQSVVAKGDFNNDGREDLLVEQLPPHGTTFTGLLYLSSSDGTYQAPISLPVVPAVVGDFNNDGKLDYAGTAQGGSQLQVFLGNGNGTFQQPKLLPSTGQFIAVDLNHDNKTDLVELSNSQTFQVWISNGDGTFTAGQSFNNVNFNVLQAGDFDGDGKPDVALILNEKGPTYLQIYYGDGAGHLGTPYTFSDPNRYEDNIRVVADANNDGRSDLVTTPFTYGPSGTSVFYPKIRLLLGNANRTLSIKDITTNGCPGVMGVADFNGDGINDLLFDEGSCSSGGSGDAVVFKPGSGSSNFGSEQTAYQNAAYAQNGGQSLQDGVTLRTTQGTRPDFLVGQPTSPNDPTRLPSINLVLLSNETTGGFPGCAVNVAEGLNICSPGVAANSPVHFSVGAAGPTPMRAAAVWVDGKKVAEQLAHAFSNYSFIDTTLSLAAGSHAIAIFGTGWDQTTQKKTFTLQVGAGGGCPAPASPGVTICSPASGSTVTTPVLVQASSTITGTLARMEVWVDGVKKYTETTSKTLSTSISLAAGSHTFVVYAVNTAGTKWSKSVTATVK